MDKDLLKKRLQKFVSDSYDKPEQFDADFKERNDSLSFYQAFTHDRIIQMTDDQIYDYISRLWAMRTWGNKRYVVNKILEENGRDNFKNNLADLVWGERPIGDRWDSFRGEIKGVGPAMMSEILCKTNPKNYMVWNRRAYVALNYLKVENLPRHDYQISGKVYGSLCTVAKGIAAELEEAGFSDSTLLAVDYFIWQELQVEDVLAHINKGKAKKEIKSDLKDPQDSEFIHNDIRDKLSEIGIWLGFESQVERKVSEGSIVDTVWEATIGNMGRVIYVFEVQTKGSIDSLILNLLKALTILPFREWLQCRTAISSKKSKGMHKMLKD